MSSAVESLVAEGGARAPGHVARYAYRCPCCEPQVDSVAGKPQRRASHRPVMAWRARLAALEAVAKTELVETMED